MKDVTQTIAAGFRYLILTATILAGSSFAYADVKAPLKIAEKGKLLFCTDLSYPPWNLVDPQSMKPAGVDVEIASAVAKQMGVASEHKNLAFQGLIPALQAGQCDAIISALIDKPERREVVNFVNYAVAGDALFVEVNTPAFFEKLTDLSGRKVVVQTGTTIEQDLVKANEELKTSGKMPIQIVTVPNNVDAMQQLMSGLVEVYFGGPEQAMYFESKMPGKIKIASKILGGRPIGIATPKGNSELHNAIQAAFDAIRTSGEYESILRKAKLESTMLP